MNFNGALLINKQEGVSSFGVIEILQDQLRAQHGVKKKDLPKLGHGGTLDPFATGLLVVLVGRAVKLAQYFLGATKGYAGTMRFGETTIPGDPTAPISERSDVLPTSEVALQDLAHRLTLQPYLQIPPMHSAKKKNGKPLYELARAGIEIERDPKLCHLYDFKIKSYEAPHAKFEVRCSSGTYIRTLAQDFGRHLGTVALLETLHRTSSGVFSVAHAMTTDQIGSATTNGASWDELPCWMPFDRLLDGYDRADATQMERTDLIQGKQNVLFNLLKRTQSPTLKSSQQNETCVAIYCNEALVAVARRDSERWGIDRVFVNQNA